MKYDDDSKAERKPMTPPENLTDPDEAKEQESEVDHEALQAYVDALSPEEATELMEILKAKTDPGNDKMTLESFSLKD